MTENKEGLFVVRLYDGFDYCWMDVFGPDTYEIVKPLGMSAPKMAPSLQILTISTTTKYSPPIQECTTHTR